MSVTMEQVLGHLDREEPDYEAAARLGSGAMPHLEALIAGGDVRRAAKAAALAARLATPESEQVVMRAAAHEAVQVRVAVAAALRAMGVQPPRLAERLLDDADAGVRKWALRSLRREPALGMRARIEAIERDDPAPAVRQRAAELLRRLRDEPP